MDPKHSILSTVGLGVGVGLGLGLGYAKSWTRSSSGSSVSQLEILETELMSQVMDGKTKAQSSTFESFPYYLNERTKALLINAAYAHLKQREFSKFTRNLSPASRTILLTGPPGSEPYLQSLAKALAHHFDAKLLILDVSDFISKIQSKTGVTKLDAQPRPFTEYMSDVLSHLTSSLSTLTADSPKVSTDRAKASASSSDSNTKESGSRAADTPSEVPPLRRTGSLGCLDEKSLVDALFKVLASVSQTSPIILYLRDVEDLVARGSKLSSLLMKRMKELSGPVLVLGSYVVQDDNKEEEKCSVKVERMFSYKINVKPPEDQTLLVKWQNQLEEDMKFMKAKDCRNHILEVLAANDVECDDLNSILFKEALVLSTYIEEILVSAISHHLMNTEEPNYRAGRLVISASSLAYGLELFQAGELGQMKTNLQENKEETSAKADAQGTTSRGPEAKTEVLEAKTEASKTEGPVKADGEKKGTEGTKPAAAKPEVAPDNEFEKRIRPEVIPAGDIGVNFNDIGALEDVKESLQELVMLPLRRPELFSRGGLIKPCKGILLFGPPGTGKTMLAKAVATEAGASFINVSMSSITSKWFGEDEKNVRALFTLAAKVAPTIIFIDEVDSMLGQRSRVGEHEAMRKIKNEFMAHWDGLLSKAGERVLVLAATNRPFDLDDAIIRRFERRIMVGLPDASNREKILRAILSKEALSDDFDFKELSSMTEGYSGSDLKNLCMAAAYRPVRELLKNEKQKKAPPKAEAKEEKKPEPEKEKAVSAEETAVSAQEKDVSVEKDTSEEKENPTTITTTEPAAAEELSFRALTMEDMKEARKQISASFSAEGAGMAELQEWNELFGEGGSRKKQPLSYFL